MSPNPKSKNDKKPKVPEPIAKYYKISDKAERLTNTMDLHHAEAYNYAANKALIGKDKLVDYDLLKEDKKQLEMAEHMGDYYMDKAKEYFKSKIDGKDELENEMLVHAYARTTKTELKQLINQLKERFTLNQFHEHKNNIVEAIRKQLKGIAKGHLTREHIDDIVKYTGAGDIVEPGTLDVDHGAMLLDVYKEQDVIPNKGLDKLGFKDYQLKKKPKKEYYSEQKAA